MAGLGQVGSSMQFERLAAVDWRSARDGKVNLRDRPSSSRLLDALLRPHPLLPVQPASGHDIFSTVSKITHIHRRSRTQTPKRVLRYKNISSCIGMLSEISLLADGNSVAFIESSQARHVFVMS